MPAGFREARSAVAVSAAAAVALAAAAALVARPITGSATAPGFAGYDAAAQSWGVDIRIVPVTQKEEVADIADEYVPHTTAQVNSTPHAVADGTFFDPGAAVRYGPGAANAAALAPNHIPPVLPAPYPYVAHTTSDKSAPRDVSGGIDTPYTPEPGYLPVTTPGVTTPPGFGVGTAHAHADPSPRAESSGAVTTVNLGPVTIGSATGDTVASQSGEAVSATTTSVLKDVTIVGVLRIAQETVIGTVQTDTSGRSQSSASITYSGVTVAGVTATIDQDGLHVGGSDVPTDAAQMALQQLNTALAKAGAQLVASQATTQKTTGSAVTAATDGFALSFADSQHAFSVLISFGHADLALRATPALPPPLSFAAAPVSIAPAPLSSVDSSLPPPSIGALPSATSPSRPATTSLRHHTKMPTTFIRSGAHVLLFPYVAVLLEISMLTALVQAYRRRHALPPRNEDLLSL